MEAVKVNIALTMSHKYIATIHTVPVTVHIEVARFRTKDIESHIDNKAADIEVMIVHTDIATVHIVPVQSIRRMKHLLKFLKQNIQGLQ